MSLLSEATEDDLAKKGFKKIVSKYSGRCSMCNQRYDEGEEIYWTNLPQTTVYCPRCYGSSLKKEVQCPECGHTFWI